MVFLNGIGSFELLGVTNLTAKPVAIFNITAHTDKVNASQIVWLRKPTAQNAPECLLQASASDLALVLLSPPYSDTFNTDAAAPTVDGVELKVPLPERVRDNSAMPAVDLLGGANLDEGTEFMSLCPDISCDASEEEFEKWSVTFYGGKLGPQVPPLYQDLEQPAPLCRSRHHEAIQWPGSKTSKFWQAAMRSAGEAAITCRTRDLLQISRGKGQKAWWYHFTATPISTLNEDNSDLPYMGAFHGAEVPFVFGDGFELSSEGERKLSDAMGCYWINFATTGDPNRGLTGCSHALSLPTWPQIGIDGDAVALSNTTIETRTGFLKDRCDLYAQFP